jgi:Ca-activated chloride channel homolog
MTADRCVLPPATDGARKAIYALRPSQPCSLRFAPLSTMFTGNAACSAWVYQEEAVKSLVVCSIVVFAAIATAAAQSPAPAAAPAADPSAPPAGAPAPAPPAGAATQAAPGEGGQGTVFRSGSSLVAINVTVSDGKRLVPNLQPDDFQVYEDGVLQRLQFFESAAVPIDLILLLDTSASMSDKIEIVHDAASGFLKSLRAADRGAVVTFGDRVNVVQTLTSDRALLEQAVRQTTPQGSTALNNALYVAMKQFARTAQQTGEVRRQAIAMLSDGEDTSSVIVFDDVLAMARKSGINIYTICLQNKYAQARADSGKKYFSESDYAMKTLAQETGAQSYFPSAVQELKGIYATISDELSKQYSIGYAPSNQRQDGRFRRIVVRVASHPEFQPRARLGYIAESGRSVLAQPGR